MDQQNRHFYKCSVCAGDSFKRVYRLGVLEEHSYYICRNCGTVCLNPRLNEKGLEEYYQTQYYGRSQPAVLVNEKYDDIRPNSRGVKIFNDLQEYVSKATKILEIGCGQGENLIVFEKNGFDNLTGLELSVSCCQRLQNFYSIDCVNRSLESYVLESGASEVFGCVIMSHVLEHFAEPEKALSMIGGLMEDEGVMYIRVPNFFGFANFFSQFGRSHTIYFSGVSLQAILNNCGFEVDRHFESTAEEIVVAARKSGRELIAITNNIDEYERVLSYLRKHKLEYIRNTIRRILGKLLLIVFGERACIAVRDCLRNFKLC